MQYPRHGLMDFPCVQRRTFLKMYRSMKEQQMTHIIIKCLQNSANRLKQKLFFWLHLHDRIHTKKLLKRQTFYYYDCILALKAARKLPYIGTGTKSLLKHVVMRLQRIKKGVYRPMIKIIFTSLELPRTYSFQAARIFGI